MKLSLILGVLEEGEDVLLLRLVPHHGKEHLVVLQGDVVITVPMLINVPSQFGQMMLLPHQMAWPVLKLLEPDFYLIPKGHATLLP